MQVELKNCNNIIEGKIDIEENKLNIKYGLNGTGKSTIASAIFNKENLSFLKPFGSTLIPEINFTTSIDNVVTFNSNFVENIVFNGDSVINNSFEIFIKSDKYDEKRKIIIEDLKSLNQETIANDDTKNLFNILQTLDSKLKLTKSGDIYQTSEFKNVLNKENIYQIPSELQQYSNFLENQENNVNWIDWKTKGFEYDKYDKCPFCADKLKEGYEIEKNKFKKTYKKNDVKHLVELKELIENLQPYINQNKYTNLINCITTPIEDSEIKMIFKKFIVENNYLLEKFIKIINFDSYNFRDSSEISKLGDIISKLKIETNELEFFDTELFNNICNTINKKIQNIYSQIDKLKAEVGAINGIIKTTIEQSKKEINDFLEIAGFDYRFDLIVEKENSAKTILKYCKNDTMYDVENIDKHLSWGEKNAFALVLFMFYALSQHADLIILDDPISSFDDNKKYAIVDRLFANTKSLKSLRNKTVVMLTHDFEPVIDFVINNKPNSEAKVSYIKNINGKLSEKEITANDIELIAKMYYNYSINGDINVVSRISFLRKFIEISNVDENLTIKNAYEILSCLIHGKNEIKRKIGHNEFEEMSEQDIQDGITYIRNFITEFDYHKLIDTKFNRVALINLFENEKNNYLKSQVFREYLEVSGKRNELDDVILKFVDEIYHIENDYMYSIDLIKYDTIPSFIIEKINIFMNAEKDSIINN